MKISCSIFVVSLFCLQSSLPVSAKDLLHALYDLINLDNAAKNTAQNAISEQYQQLVSDTDQELRSSTIPTINETYRNMESYVQKLDDQMSSLGYSLSSCLVEIQEILETVTSLSSEINITTKALEEKTYVYNNLFLDTYLIGTYSLNSIQKEETSITNEFYECIRSSNPEYCNGTLYEKVLEKQKVIPLQFQKEAQLISTNLIQQGLLYKTRLSYYVEEAANAVKPYVALLDSCAQKLIMID